MNEPRLFSPQECEPKRCKLRSCGASRKNLCKYDADNRDVNPVERPRRPRGCLNAYDPATAPLPDTY